MSPNKLFEVLSLAGRTIRARILGPAAPKAARREQHRRRPGFEALEDRWLLSALPVLPAPQFRAALHGHHHHHGHAAQHVTILTPNAGSTVSHFLTVTGQVTGKGHGWPVVLVQPELPGEPWYVQPAVTKLNPDGTFSTQVYIGNTTTPPGTQFRIVVILAKSHAQAQHSFPEGKMLKALPAGLPESQVVQVSLAGSHPHGPSGPS